VPDGPYLRLYDRQGHLRLTQGEVDRYRAEAEAQARRFAERRAEAEAEKARIFAEKLRSLGMDPEQLL
jgi:regulator of protease activity HflC (stomatin/prohibitin superfamily)